LEVSLLQTVCNSATLSYMNKADLKQKQLLRECGFRATPRKITILNALEESNRPLAVAELHDKIGRSTLDQATLYRNLEAFVASGIARRVDLQQGRAHYYELARDHHHHLVCAQCGKVKDIDVCNFEETSKHALRQAKEFVSIQNHVFELIGLCKLCAQAT
jgi:Fur family transcriptional regulator, zinc uptake regulator